VRASTWRDSELVGPGPAQGTFRNGVAELRTTLPAAALLAVCKALEAEAGRTLPAPRNHPRPLDLDLLLFGDERIDTRDLAVPHPRWHERDFVREPLRELGLDLDALPRHPGLEVLDAPGALAARTAGWLAGECVIGIVPTMGSLHAGHRQLLEIARQECDRVIATVFVNPLQFGPGEDFAAYPRDLTADVAVCRQAGADVVFAPPVAAMYDPEFCSHVDVGRAAEDLEGALRPGHFRGVATVVARLLALSRPHRAYFGEKDAQQLAVIRRLVVDLNIPVDIAGVPTVREADGLALSSRNVRLSAEERSKAIALYRALRQAERTIARGERDARAVERLAAAVIPPDASLRLEYLEIVDPVELQRVDRIEGTVLVAGALWVGNTRLIDNLTISARPT
jgi:pantoate--beta-alanine ligase